MGEKEFLLNAEPEPIGIAVSKTAVVVVDMQNAFISKGGYFDLCGFDLSPGTAIINPCQILVNLCREKEMKIIYLQMGFSADLSDVGGPDSPFVYKSRALKLLRERPEVKNKLQIYGTWGAEVIRELAPQPGDIVLRKQKHDGFIGTNLDFILNTHNIRFLLFLGVATNICVQTTLAHAFSLGYFPFLVSDAVNNMGPALTQEATIFNVRSSFGWVTTSGDVINTIGQAD